jgi:hypothetical protein
MNIPTTMRRTAATASIVLALGAITTLPASASGGGGIEHRGSCSMSTDWKLKAKADNGRIEVEAEIDSNVNGQTWTWRILHNGGVSAHGTAKTQAPSGSFTVRRLLVNAPGTDSIGLRAHNAATGESCSGGLRF